MRLRFHIPLITMAFFGVVLLLLYSFAGVRHVERSRTDSRTTTAGST